MTRKSKPLPSIIDAADYAALVRSRWTEAEFQRHILALAKENGWLIHHARPARTNKGWRTAIQGDVGFPDLILARSGRVIAAELKVGKRRPTSEQNAWLNAFSAAGIPAYIWEPIVWREIEETLASKH